MKDKKNVKQMISENSAESYEALRSFYLKVINGEIFDVKVTREGEVVNIPPTISARVEAAAALQRMDIDKVQGNAKPKDSEDAQAVSNDALKALSKLAEIKGKKL